MQQRLKQHEDRQEDQMKQIRTEISTTRNEAPSHRSPRSAETPRSDTARPPVVGPKRGFELPPKISEDFGYNGVISEEHGTT